MRKAINENPIVQVVLLGILGIVVALLFVTRIMGGNEAEPAPATTASSVATAPTTTPAASTEPVAASQAPSLGPGVAGFEPGRGLPAEVVKAYESGDVVVLLVVQKQGIEDGRLRSEVEALRSRGDVSLFIAEAEDVARYSRITQGVSLDRVPALVAIEPRSQAKGKLPGASVSYGFRGPDSVRQAVQDILYKGKKLPYHPG